MDKARVTALASLSGRQAAEGTGAAARTQRPDVPLHDALNDNRPGHVAQEDDSASSEDDNLEKVPDALEHAPQISVAKPVEGTGPARVSFHTTYTNTLNSTSVVVNPGAGNSANDDKEPNADGGFANLYCFCCLIVLFSLGLGVGLFLRDLLIGDCPAGFSRMLIEGDQYDEICRKNGALYDFCCRDDPTDPVRWRLSLTPVIDYDAACPAGYSQFYAGSCASACGCSQPDASDKTSLKCDMCCKNVKGTCAVIDLDCPDGFGRLPRITRLGEYNVICAWNGDRYDFCCRDKWEDPVRWRLSKDPGIDYTEGCDDDYSRLFSYPCNVFCGCSKPDADVPDGLTCRYCCRNNAGYCYRRSPSTT